jgi:hypothetical protein
VKTIVCSVALLLLGCGASPPPALFKGVLWVSWTIEGQPASDTTCAGIDHLVITVESTPTQAVKIAPVVCTKGNGWQRDDVPEGSDDVIVDAVDATERTLLESVSMIGVTETAPATPTTVDLQPL